MAEATACLRSSQLSITPFGPEGPHAFRFTSIALMKLPSEAVGSLTRRPAAQRFTSFALWSGDSEIVGRAFLLDNDIPGSHPASRAITDVNKDGPFKTRGYPRCDSARTRVLNGDLRNTFRNWYPGMEATPQVEMRAA